MQIPRFLEANHALVHPLSQLSDQELLTLFQRYPDRGRYFVALLCRYTPIVYTLVSNSARSPVQADYLFAMIWRHIYYELGGLDLRSTSPDKPALTLQNWIINITAHCINQAHLPPVEEIQYSIKAAPPALWCYVEQSLDQLPPLQRLITVMSQTYHWSETRISAYLQAEGEALSAAQVKAQLHQAARALEQVLPADLRNIYFNEPLDEESSDWSDMAVI